MFHFKTSDDVLDLIDVPQEVVVLGGGIVACVTCSVFKSYWLPCNLAPEK